MFEPSYIELYGSGELQERVDKLEAMLTSCDICPHVCYINRLKDEIAWCYSGYLPIVSSYCPHFGEEPVISGTRGAGNIFFGNCSMRCVYCQNYQISQNWVEECKNQVSFGRLAEIMLELQGKGCHNIGLVSPTHFVPQIVKALVIAVRNGLNLPLVYNTNAYDSLEVLRLLNGIIDIYLPDIKYGENEMGWQYSKVKDYATYARKAIREMHRQVGSELIIEDGLVKRGLIVRHLVLPNDVAGSKGSLEWIRNELGKDISLSIMAQYFPSNRTEDTILLNRKIHESEYERLVKILEELKMENGWIQDFESQECYKPDFTNRLEPFKV
jgi:putative pyruvate formate lyase activating enzyme